MWGLDKIWKPKERRPAPVYRMYENTTYWDDKEGHQGYGNILCGSFSSLEEARETALRALKRSNKNRIVTSFDLHDDMSVTNNGYARDNWELTRNTKVWTYWKDDRAEGPFLYDADGKWLGWQRDE